VRSLPTQFATMTRSHNPEKPRGRIQHLLAEDMQRWHEAGWRNLRIAEIEKTMEILPRNDSKLQAMTAIYSTAHNLSIRKTAAIVSIGRKYQASFSARRSSPDTLRP
jgi:hypothetical protein